jgi:hypothetical protein
MIPLVAIIGGITVVVVGMMTKARVRELEIRERIAMIERGLVPPPEKDPQGFERAMDRLDRSRGRDDGQEDDARAPRRYRSGGVTLMGVGLGLMVLIGLAGGSPQIGLGVGGFLVFLGIAFFVNSVFEVRQSRDESERRARASGPVSPAPTDSLPRS